MPAPVRSEIRDLILKLREIAQDHPAFSQVNMILANTFDHMAAVARLEEINRAQHERPAMHHVAEGTATGDKCPCPFWAR